MFVKMYVEHYQLSEHSLGNGDKDYTDCGCVIEIGDSCDDDTQNPGSISYDTIGFTVNVADQRKMVNIELQIGCEQLGDVIAVLERMKTKIENHEDYLKNG